MLDSLLAMKGIKKPAKKSDLITEDPRWPLFQKVCYRADLSGLFKPQPITGSTYLVEIDPRKGHEEWVRIWSPTGKCVAGFSVYQPWSDDQIDAELKDIAPGY